MSGRELGAAHDAMRERCRRGEWAELGPLPDGDDDLPDYDDEDFWRGRTIDGAWLADFVTSAQSHVHHRGVLVRGARIVGGLDLEGAELSRRLALVRCQLGAHAVDLRGGRARRVDLSGAYRRRRLDPRQPGRGQLHPGHPARVTALPHHACRELERVLILRA